MFQINNDEYRLLKVYKEYKMENGINSEGDVYEEQINEFRRADGAAQKRDERAYVPFSFDDIDTRRFPEAVSPSAESTYFSEYDEEEVAQLKDIFSGLTDVQRERIYMHVVDELSFKDIADIENVSPQTVRESYWRGIAHLKKYGEFLQKTTIKSWASLLR